MHEAGPGSPIGNREALRASFGITEDNIASIRNQKKSWHLMALLINATGRDDALWQVPKSKQKSPDSSADRNGPYYFYNFLLHPDTPIDKIIAIVDFLLIEFTRARSKRIEISELANDEEAFQKFLEERIQTLAATTNPRLKGFTPSKLTESTTNLAHLLFTGEGQN